MCVCAILAALSFVLALLAKTIFGPGPYRLTFENMPIFIASFAYGPVMGAVVAILADIFSCINTGMTPIPLVTVGAVVLAISSGLVYRLCAKMKFVFKLAISVSVGHILGSMLLKTLGLYQFYGSAVLFRIPIYIVVIILEFTLLYLLFKRRSMRDLVKSVGGDLKYED